MKPLCTQYPKAYQLINSLRLEVKERGALRLIIYHKAN
jgi:hypothetical protein